MPKRHRDFQKRRLGYVLGSLEKVMEHAILLKSEFDEVTGLDGIADDYEEKLIKLSETNDHAKYALMLHVGILQALTCQTTFEQFALLAWGSLPDQLSRWTNTSQDYKKDHPQ